MSTVVAYPRKLRPKERDLLDAVLPEDKPGYMAYRRLISSMEVIGEGRRGEGNLVLGMPGERPDFSSPLGPVVAYGGVETTRDRFSVTVREYAGNQIDVEIVSAHGEAIPDHYEEKRRWSYSTWMPGMPSPDTGERAREIPVSETLVLAILAKERRLLVYDGSSGMNHLVPVTTFYNELMVVKNIRDPDIALHSGRLFDELASYRDGDLRDAFVAYNRLKRRFPVAAAEESRETRRGILSSMKGAFGKPRP